MRRIAYLAFYPILLMIACGRAEVREESRMTPDFTNLVVIVVDALRSDHLPAYGYSRQTAPFLTELARQGIQLQGYSASSWTRSSMATLFTGLHPQRHQTIGRKDRLPVTVPFFSEILSAHGFSTAALVTNGNVSSQFGFRRGYTIYKELIDVGKPRAAQVVDEALGLADGLQSPFYLYVHFMEPHDPYVPKVPWEYDPGTEAVYIQPQDVFRQKLPLDDHILRRLVNQYDGEIRELDRELNRMLDGLAAQGLLDRTLVVLTSDHGEEFGEHGSLVHGHTLHEESIAVPFILWSAGDLRYYQSGAGFHQVNFLPTMLEAVGITPPPEIDGRSFWRKIRDTGYRPRDELLFHLDLDGFQALAIRTPQHKLIRSNQSSEQLFYDLRKSPDESHTAKFEFLERIRLERRLRRLNRDLEARSHDRESVEVSGEVREQLQALGYLAEPEQAETGSGEVIPQKKLDLARMVAGTIDLRGPSEQLIEGWIFTDRNGTWSSPRARFAIRIQQQSRKIVLAGHSVAGRRSVRCEIAVDGQSNQVFQLSPGEFEIEVPLPADVKAAGVATVSLTIHPPLRVEGIPQPVGLHWSRFSVE